MSKLNCFKAYDIGVNLGEELNVETQDSRAHVSRHVSQTETIIKKAI